MGTCSEQPTETSGTHHVPVAMHLHAVHRPKPTTVKSRHRYGSTSQHSIWTGSRTIPPQRQGTREPRVTVEGSWGWGVGHRLQGRKEEGRQAARQAGRQLPGTEPQEASGQDANERAEPPGVFKSWL